MFEVAASLGEKRYDWSNKVQICLNPLELAEIVTDPKEERTFYHDTCKCAGQRLRVVHRVAGHLTAAAVFCIVGGSMGQDQCVTIAGE